MIRVPDIIKHLIIINVIFFVASNSMKNIDLQALLNLHYYNSPNFRPWQLVTSLFMHANIGHIFSNMLGLYFFGSPMVQLWGRNKFLFFYFSAGVGASLIYMGYQYFEFESIISSLQNLGIPKDYLMETFKSSKYLADYPISEKASEIYIGSLLGASGALFGLLAAYGWYFPNSEIYLYFVLPIKAKIFIPVIVIADLISGITGQPLLSPVNTAYFAHVGGALIGLVMAIIWKKNIFRTH